MSGDVSELPVNRVSRPPVRVMAIYRLQITRITRGGGHSSVGAAAYRAGERIRDDRTNELHNHSRRKDVTHSEIMLPGQVSGENMDWARNRASLWNSVENAETRKNSRVATEIQVTLPFELPPARRLEMARTFSQEVADHYRVAVDLAVHDPRPSGDPRNFHAHLLLTTREVSPEGLGAKAGLDMQTSERIRLGLPNMSQEFTAIRERWATLTNEALKEANIEARVDHRSLAAQGIDREPKPHIPFAVYKIERAGKHSEVAESIRADYNARVQARLERAVEQANSAAAEPTNASMAGQPVSATVERTDTAAVERAAPAAAGHTADAAAEHAAPAAAEHTLGVAAERAAPPAAGHAASAAAERAAPVTAETNPTTLRPATRTLEDIRREARENWLRMRAEQSANVTAISSGAHTRNAAAAAANPAVAVANPAAQPGSSAAQARSLAAHPGNAAPQASYPAVRATNSAAQATNSAAQTSSPAAHATNPTAQASDTAAHAGSPAAQATNSATQANTPAAPPAHPATPTRSAATRPHTPAPDNDYQP